MHYVFSKENVGLGFFSEHFALEFLPKEKMVKRFYVLPRLAVKTQAERSRSSKLQTSEQATLRRSGPEAALHWLLVLSKSGKTVVLISMIWIRGCFERILCSILENVNDGKKHIAESMKIGTRKQALGRGGSAQIIRQQRKITDTSKQLKMKRLFHGVDCHKLESWQVLQTRH